MRVVWPAAVCRSSAEDNTPVSRSPSAGPVGFTFAARYDIDLYQDVSKPGSERDSFVWQIRQTWSPCLYRCSTRRLWRGPLDKTKPHPGDFKIRHSLTLGPPTPDNASPRGLPDQTYSHPGTPRPDIASPWDPLDQTLDQTEPHPGDPQIRRTPTLGTPRSDGAPPWGPPDQTEPHPGDPQIRRSLGTPST
ncbi:hypothetical protein NHX12_003451 [Muraenolepis orangiensis]|uniref:Uncharacterized protein n=1 Tax=Muraenolepis orangiensis TaxID=630683 RepID=A0A9Q0DYT7_9TELE|nr:hypothetical protein NHX12_003451 [Muraenolepis orangiensis]